MPVILIGEEEYDFLNTQRKLTPGRKKYESFGTVVKRMIEQEKNK